MTVGSHYQKFLHMQNFVVVVFITCVCMWLALRFCQQREYFWDSKIEITLQELYGYTQYHNVKKTVAVVFPSKEIKVYSTPSIFFFFRALK